MTSNWLVAPHVMRGSACLLPALRKTSQAPCRGTGDNSIQCHPALVAVTPEMGVTTTSYEYAHNVIKSRSPRKMGVTTTAEYSYRYARESRSPRKMGVTTTAIVQTLDDVAK